MIQTAVLLAVSSALGQHGPAGTALPPHLLVNAVRPEFVLFRVFVAGRAYNLLLSTRVAGPGNTNWLFSKKPSVFLHEDNTGTTQGATLLAVPRESVQAPDCGAANVGVCPTFLRPMIGDT